MFDHTNRERKHKERLPGFFSRNQTEMIKPHKNLFHVLFVMLSPAPIHSTEFASIYQQFFFFGCFWVLSEASEVAQKLTSFCRPRETHSIQQPSGEKGGKKTSRSFSSNSSDRPPYSLILANGHLECFLFTSSFFRNGFLPSGFPRTYFNYFYKCSFVSRWLSRSTKKYVCIDQICKLPGSRLLFCLEIFYLRIR